MNKHRELWADYAKGICILLVFVGHLSILPKFLRTIIYLFHMPAFFFCMGFYTDTSQAFGPYLKKKVRQLLIPYIVYDCIFVCWDGLQSFLLYHYIPLSEMKNIAVSMVINWRNTAYPATHWFLVASFTASMVYYAFRKTIRHIPAELAAVVGGSLLFLYLNRGMDLTIPWYLDVAFPCTLFMYFGRYIKEKELSPGKKEIALFTLLGITAAAVISGVFSANEDGFPVDYHMMKLFPYSLVSVGGMALCLSLYGVCRNFRRRSILSYVGENSLIYYMFSWIPDSFACRLLTHFQITVPVISACMQLLCILFLTPLVVVVIKCFFWFAFGKKKEKWSVDYSRLFRKQR